MRICTMIKWTSAENIFYALIVNKQANPPEASNEIRQLTMTSSIFPPKNQKILSYHLHCSEKSLLLIRLKEIQRSPEIYCLAGQLTEPDQEILNFPPLLGKSFTLSSKISSIKILWLKFTWLKWLNRTNPSIISDHRQPIGTVIQCATDDRHASRRFCRPIKHNAVKLSSFSFFRACQELSHSPRIMKKLTPGK